MTSENNGAPAAHDDAGMTKAEHDAAVKDARAAGKAEGVEEGKALGAKAERDRLAAIISADGIKGNAARQTAALELAMKSPDMSAEDVTAFVTGNVPEQVASASLANRNGKPDSLAAAGGQTPEKKVFDWHAITEDTNRRYGVAR